jgi:hypothetical protein
MSENGRYRILIGSIKNQTRPMTNVQHNQNGSSWHTSFSSNAQNHSVHSEPSVYSAVQTFPICSGCSTIALFDICNAVLLLAVLFTA